MRPGPSLVRVAGALLLLVPFVPLARMYRWSIGAMAVHVPPEEWLLGLFVFGASAWLLIRLVPRLPRFLLAVFTAIDARLRGPRFAAVVLLVFAALLVLTSTLVFRHRPLLVDSVVQLFQARIFRGGHLTAPAPPGEAFVAVQHMLVMDGRWFSQYPPGHPALLAMGLIAGAPWLVPVLLSFLSAGLLYVFCVRIWDERTGRIALVLVPLAPFFWFMGASFMNHVSCLFFAAVFLVTYERWESGGGAGWALAAGAAIGAAGLSRPLTALAVAAVFAPIGLVHVARTRRLPSAGLALAGGLAAVAVYLLYNAATTGDALTPGYIELWGEAHGLGFHRTPWGDLHTPAAGLRNELVDLSLLSSFFLEWPIPALIPAALYGLFTGGRDLWSRRLFALFLALPAAYFFYWHRDAYLGPRFLYAGLLALIPLTARAFTALGEIRVSRPRLHGFAVVLVTLCFGYTVLYSAPARFSVYASSFSSMKVDLPAIAHEAGIERGVVFVAVSWGNRLLARMRGAGIDAATAETVYRRADHCRIERLLRRARAENWAAGRLSSALEALPTAGVEQVAINGDPTLRLVPGRPLAPVCRAELAHDAAGYGNWLPFLLANDPALADPILYVRDLRDLNDEFLARRPGRRAWLYRPSGLVPLAPASASSSN